MKPMPSRNGGVVIDLTKSGEREVRGVLKAIGLDSDEDTPARDNLWRSTWLSILCLRIRHAIDNRGAVKSKRRRSA